MEKSDLWARSSLENVETLDIFNNENVKELNIVENKNVEEFDIFENENVVKFGKVLPVLGKRIPLF